MIANYTTSIDASKTAGEIQQMLGAAGAVQVSLEYQDRAVSGVAFGLDFQGHKLWFRLPFRPEGVLASLRRDGAPKRLLTLDHARNVGARVVRDWIRAQLALVDAGQAHLPEIMLPYLVQTGGQTMWERMLAERLSLPPVSE